MLSSQNSHRRATSLKGLSVPALVLALAAVCRAETATVSLSQMPVPSQLAQATYLGKPSASTSLTVSVSLAPRDPAGLAAYADAVAQRGNPNFRKFLTPAEVGSRFGASATTVNATVAYLKSKGLKISLQAANGMAVVATGTVAQAETAFGTKLGLYRMADGAATRDFVCYSTAVKAPPSFASKVVSVGGLQGLFAPKGRSTLSPSMTRVLYNAAPLYNPLPSGLNHKGEGIHIGITNYDGYRLSNLPLLYSQYGLPTPPGGVGSNVHVISANGRNGNVDNPDGEGDLDIQLVLAVAPLCELYVYDDGATTSYVTDYTLPLILEANQNIVDIVSESYGFPTDSSTASYIASAHNQHLAMSAQGITYMLATGDYGTDLLGNDYPNFDPEILQIGGTVATVDSTGVRIKEDGWDGSGAGWSTFNTTGSAFTDNFNTRPSWQHGATVPTAPDRRIFPDIALHAAGANDGSALEYQAYNFVFNGSLSAVSGTSASSPTFAGLFGLIVQELTAAGSVTPDPITGRVRMGPIQKTYIYPIWDGRSDIFLDILTGDAGKLPDGSEAIGKTGWDFVTGYGAPNAQGMLNAFEETLVPPMTTDPSDASIYTSTSPTFTYGTSAQNGTGELHAADGISYSILSKTQSGVGQVAAATLDFTLQTDASTRKAVVLKTSVLSERLTTDYLYLYNWSTSKYDLVKTVTSSGSAATLSSQVSLTKYVNGNSVRVLVRALKPTRLGSGAFRLNLDQAIVVETSS